MSNPKPGAYPYADRANLFGTLFLQFHTRPRNDEARAQAYEGMLALIYPKARHDKDFMKLYEEARRDGHVGDDEMVRLVMELCRVVDDSAMWDYPQWEEFSYDVEGNPTDPGMGQVEPRTPTGR